MGEAKRKKTEPQAGAKLTVHRLVILEWLSEEEPKTGTALAQHLRTSAQDLEVVCYQCKSAKDVIAKINDLTDEMSNPSAGIPILHIEAHGFSPTGEADSAIGICGPSSSGSNEPLLWKDLAAPLRRLNIATRFNLIFVGAACWSDSSIYSIHLGSEVRPLPFVLAIGFATTVYASNLESAMVELYTKLLVQHHSLQESLELAHSKLDPTNEALAWFSVPRIIRKAALDAVCLVADPHQNEDRYVHMIANLAGAGRRPIPPAEFHRNHLTHVPGAIDKIVGGLLAYDALPDNRERFGFDGKKLSREAIRARRPGMKAGG